VIAARRAASRSCVALLLAVGCAGARAPQESTLAASDPRPAALVAALVGAGAERESLRGVARVALDGPGGSGRAKQVLALARPAQLRVEVLGLLDQTIALLVTDGTRYRLARSADRVVETGPVHDGLLADVAGIALTPAEAVRVLLGAPVAADARASGAGVALADGGVRAVVARPDAFEREALDFDAQGRLSRWALLGADGAPLLEAIYTDPRPAGDGWFAHAVELRDAASGAVARFVWSRVELNPVLDAALFELPPEPVP
jgi:hypothetical protein